MAGYTKKEKSWMMYDWATSAYSIVITTAIFPIYYKSVAQQAGVSAANSTAFYSYSVSIATFILAMLGPILGAIADYKGMKKKFFIFFFLLGSISTLSLLFVPSDQWLLLLIIYVLTSVGASGANLFYNAFIVDVTKKERMDEISARGFALGYIGSVIPFVISIAIIILSQNGILPFSASVASKIAFFITAVWWISFTIPMLKNVTQIYYVEREPKIIVNSFKRLGQTFHDIRKYRNIFLFLLAYFFYIDGVTTIISMATVYGTDVGLGQTDLILALLAVQIVAAPFALLFGKLANIFGAKVMLYTGIGVYTFITIYAVFLDTVLEFWILAMLVATSQGGIQALSRSYFAQMVPKEKSNEFFGFYNVFGRFAAVSGPFLVGITTQLTGNSSYGVFSLVILFIIGLILLIFVPDTKKGHSPIDVAPPN
ncbi:MFS transporter [Fervidibacillus halotolerans]|uniref:MFS transporter n=1 Tax=Fervidibacillus halotolerans TaxID=2980027 RepID=A0A9E8RZ32_9BACI|nr:MFS transporter [Fervidibacillus halotolerans]WAA12888.1 MFS transporter [Fervidibacillus halotolerans]